MALHSFINRADLVQMQRWAFYFNSKAGCIRNPRQLTNEPTFSNFGWWSGGEKSDTEDIPHPFFLHFLQAIAMSSGVVTPGSWVHVAVIYGGRQTGASAWNTSVNFGMLSSRIYSIVAFTETQTIDLYSTLSFTLFLFRFHIYSTCLFVAWHFGHSAVLDSMSGTLRFYVDGILAYERLGVDLEMASLPLQCAGGVSASFTGGLGNWPAQREGCYIHGFSWVFSVSRSPEGNLVSSSLKGAKHWPFCQNI